MPDCKSIEAIKIATKEFVEEKIIPDTLNGFNQYVNENLELSTLNDPTILLTDEQLRQRNAEIALNKWKTEEHDKVRENYTNIENMESMYPISQAMRNQINTRHEAFRHTDNFDRDCNANANRTSAEFINEERTDLAKLKHYMASYLASYKSLYSYKISMSTLLNEKKRSFRTYTNKIDTYKQNLHIDNRKDSYIRKNYDFYKTIYFYILILFYSLFALYLIFSDFIREKKYKNKYYVGAILAYLLAPYIIQYILVYIYKSYIYILESYNLREEIISYPYIVEDKDKYSKTE